MRSALFEMKNETALDLVAHADHHDHDHQHEMDDNLILAKALAMLLLGLTSFFLGVLPIKLATWLRWKLPGTPSPPHHHSHHHSHTSQPIVISLLLCFGGGVLLYTTFMHLFPEVREGMDELIYKDLIPQILIDSKLHLAELIFCVGFFFVYLVEEVVHAILDRTHHEDDEEILHRTVSFRRCRAKGMLPRISLSKNTTFPISSTQHSINASTQILFRSSTHNIPGKMREELDPRGKMTPGALEASETASSGSTAPPKTTVVKSFRGLLTVLALSFHAVFEGLAVGLQKSSMDVWYLCAAIATHKLVIAFCVGVELVSMRTKTILVVLYVATFAAVSPLGIGLGLWLSSSGTEAEGLNVASVVLQGMAAGTLLYVVFFEVLQREKNNNHHGLCQLVAILAGFLVMVALHLFVGHEHSHTHDHSHLDHDHDHDHR